MPSECLRSHPDLTVLELLFGSGVVLLVGRLLIVAAVIVMLACGLFVLGSIVVRMRHGHWLRRVGPFEVSDTTAGQVDRQMKTLARTVGEQRVRIAELESVLRALAATFVAVDTEGDS